MKISLIIISVILVLSVFLPFLLFVYNGTKNTSSIKKQVQKLIKDNGITYSFKDIWRKNFMGISADNKIISYIHFKNEKPFVYNISLTDLKQCHIVKTHQNNSNKTVALKTLALEFIYKTSAQPNTNVLFFDIDEDLSEDFELQRIEKWHALITKAINESQVLKMAS